MRILTLSCEYPPVGGGGATACRTLAEALARAGHAVDVVTARMPGLPNAEERHGVRIFRAAGLRRHRHYSTAAEQASFVPSMYRLARRLHAAHGYELVHCHFVVPTGAVAYMLRQRLGLPYVLTAHGSDVPGYNPDRFALLHRVIGPAWQRIIAGAAATTSPSDFVRGLIEAQTATKVAVIPNAFDAPQRPASVPRTKRVLVVARLVERKGVQHLIAALGAMDADWELVVVGDGPLLPELRQLAAKRGVPARFTGFVPREELPALYGSAAIFVLPSLQENFPMVLLEAMAAGCAVVTTSAPGCAEVVGDAGCLIAPGDVAALRETLTDLTRDPDAVARLGERGRERVRDFASKRIAARFIDVFGRCVGPAAAEAIGPHSGGRMDAQPHPASQRRLAHAPASAAGSTPRRQGSGGSSRLGRPPRGGTGRS